jgi:hypothetical protein
MEKISEHICEICKEKQADCVIKTEKYHVIFGKVKSDTYICNDCKEQYEQEQEKKKKEISEKLFPKNNFNIDKKLNK